MMNRLRSVLVGGTVIAVALAGCGNEKTDVKESPEPVTNVAVYEVAPMSFDDYITLPVQVRSYREVNLGIMNGGRVTALRADKGNRVSAGAVLLETDADMLKAALEQARAQFEYQQQEFARAQQLYEGGSFTDAALDAAQLALASARNALTIAQENLDNATLEAPFNGTVVMRQAELGEILAPGAPAFRLIDNSRVRVKAGIPEKYIASFRVGSNANIRFDAIPGETFTGTIGFISPEADPQVRTFPVEIIVNNPGGHIRSGIMGNARILRSRLENAILIPLDALVETQDGRSVYIVRSDNTAERRAVTLGEASSELMIEVVAGIQPGDRVIVKGQHDLVTGENVKVTEVLNAGDIGGES